MTDIDRFQEIFTAKQETYLEGWKRFLRFRSVSADPAYDGECRACAAWLQEGLVALGFDARVEETAGKPVVMAERPGDGSLSTVLYYGHYDVQPVDPLSLWSSDPFEPELREGRLYARGAEDNKGQTFAFLKAVEALVQHNLLRRPLKILIEGEEECGSRGLSASLPRLSPSLQSDILMVCDTGTPDQRYSTLTMGLRGLISMEVVLHGPHRDLHSGVHGGMVRNPAAELARIVGSLHLPSGRIAVPGFYDGVAELSERDRSLANGAPFDLDRYREEVGVVANGGEAGYSWAERRGLRPTLEVNGIYGGYTGKGGKTIIPSAAGVKLTARLVQGQDPARTLAAVLAYIQSLVPEGLRLEVVDSAVAGGAFSLATSSPRVAQVRSILEKVTGEGTTVCMWEGASIPIIPELAKSAGGAEPILVGYGLEEDAIHAPNESFSLAQFRRVFLYSALFLSEIR